ncbi:hypothetical protein OHD62_00445 [Mesorhizobium sp. YC-39]|uniref:hypothetical protein n=1 Tax=unclassified Mesorhizobium TaxID=325217 RepID=UPI0021E7F278|nr:MULTISPECIES: hypothetical protein [unclassified Mesorhizobium]MCV3206771.1 hypothetical protein [Mesorhizobium sp. YC-2]MCV3226829.1 hypothetical protein [Mesorhizobium sp. YC-39]
MAMVWTAEFLGPRHGMGPRVKPEDDEGAKPEFHSSSGQSIGTIYLLSDCKRLEKTVGLSKGGRSPVTMEHLI